MRAAGWWAKGWRPLVLIAVVFVLRAGFMGLPFGDPDLGGIAYNADLLLTGKLPYQHSFEQKLPGTFLLWAAVFAVGGRGPTALAVVAVAWHAALALVVYGVCRWLWGEGPAFAGAVLYALFSSSPAVAGTVPNYETWMILPLLTSFWLLLLWVRRRTAWLLLLTGTSASLGILMKQQAVFNVVLLVVGALFIGWKQGGPRHGIASGAWLGVGGAIPVLGVSLFFVARGAWPALVECLHPRGLAVYSTAAPLRVVWELGAKHTREMMLEGFSLWVLGLSGAILLLVSDGEKARGHVRWLVLGWGVASFAGVVAGVRFFQHYYQQFLPFLAMGVAAVWAALRPKLRSAVGVLLLVMIVLSGWRTFAANERVLWWRIKNLVTGSHVPRSLSQEVAAFLASHTAENEPIYVWGHGEDIYYLAGRFAPTRYYKYWVFLNPPPVGVGRLTANPRAGAYLEEFLADMSVAPPRFIVVDPRWSEASPDLVPEFARFLEDRYRPARTFESVQVHSLVER